MIKKTINRILLAQGAQPLDDSIGLLELAQFAADILCKLLRGICISYLLRGKGLVFLGRGTSLRNKHKIYRNGAFIVEDYAEIQGKSKRGIFFGRKVTVGRFAQIRPSGYYGREMGEGMEVGDYSNIGPGCFIGCAGYIKIGKHVMMGAGVHMHAESHKFDDADKKIAEQGVSRSGITIGDNVWIGAGTIILDGVKIGEGSVVGAGAVVTKSFPAGVVIAGVPAKIVKSRSA